MKNDSGTIESAEMLSDAIREIVSRIKTDSDTNPVELEAIKKLIRKNVPFTMRGAFSAYILRALISRPAAPAKKQNDRKREPRQKKEAPEMRKPQAPKAEEKKAERPAPQQQKKQAEKPARKEEQRQPREERQAREPREQREIPEGAKTLYVSVGRMKHLYPKQLSEIFQEALGITRDDIYAIRIHDKYSFITLSEENCEKAIEKITGMSINGRVASVSYSRLENKEAKAEAPAEAPAAAPAEETEAPAVEEAPAAAEAPAVEEAPAAAAEETAAPAEN